MSTLIQSQPDQPSPMIHAAILAIMQEVEPIAKSLRNEQQKFNYRGIDQVYNAVHDLFAKHGVYATSTILEMHHDSQPSKSGGTNRFAVLKMRFTFRAKDGSEVHTEVVGEGMDSGDKANNKAMSVANKYALLQILMIPTAMVDPDGPEPHDNPTRNEQAPSAPSREQRKQAPKPPEDPVLAKRLAEIKRIKGKWFADLKQKDPAAAKQSSEELATAFANWVRVISKHETLNPYEVETWGPAEDEAFERCGIYFQ